MHDAWYSKLSLYWVVFQRNKVIKNITPGNNELYIAINKNMMLQITQKFFEYFESDKLTIINQ